MAFSNIDSGLSLGKLLHIVFDNQVYIQISEDYRDFEQVERMKILESLPREYRYFLQKSLGPGAIGARNPGTSGRAFPSAQQVSTSEVTAKLKELNATVELEYNLFSRAMKTPEKYGEPLMIELAAKSTAMKRRLAGDLYGNGLGVLGFISSQTSGVITLQSTNATSYGHAGMFEQDELVKHYAANGGSGSSVTVASGTFSYWRVSARDIANNTITVVPVNTAGAETTISSWTPTAGEQLVKENQPTVADTTSVSDYGSATEVMVGLESWSEDDGRTIYGVAMSGALTGTRYSGGANPIDVKSLQRGLDLVKRNVGQDRYKYKKMTMSPETQAALIDSRETDRRFMAIADNKRGIEGSFGYAHGNDLLAAVTSEFCAPKRIYCIPEAKGGKKVMAYVGSDFEAVEVGGADKFLKPSADGGYVGNIQSFVQGVGAIICNHPRSLLCVEDFTNA